MSSQALAQAPGDDDVTGGKAWQRVGPSPRPATVGRSGASPDQIENRHPEYQFALLCTMYVQQKGATITIYGCVNVNMGSNTHDGEAGVAEPPGLSETVV